MNKREIKRLVCAEVATEIENIINLTDPPLWALEDGNEERWDTALQELADEMRKRGER